MPLDPQEHYRRLERTYLTAPINHYFRPRIEVGDGTAEIAIDVRPDLHHAAAAVHGAVYFKALDDAAFFAVNSVVQDVFVLTASFNLYLLRSIADGLLVARGRLVHRTRRTFVGESELTDGEGRLLARGSGSFVRSRIPLDERIGYD